MSNDGAADVLPANFRDAGQTAGLKTGILLRYAFQYPAVDTNTRDLNICSAQYETSQ